MTNKKTKRGTRGPRAASVATKKKSATRSRAKQDPRAYSSQVMDGLKQTASRAMLRAVGFTDEDFVKPQIGIASTWADVTPCNMHIDALAREAARGADEAGGKSVLFQYHHGVGTASRWARPACATHWCLRVIYCRLDRGGGRGRLGLMAWWPSAAATRTCRAAPWRLRD